MRLCLLVVVDVEKVRIQQGLDNASNDRNGLDRPLEGGFGEISIHPVGDIESPVQSQGEEVMRGNGVCFSGPLQHEQLRQDRDRLEPNGKGPKDLGIRQRGLSHRPHQPGRLLIE